MDVIYSMVVNDVEISKQRQYLRRQIERYCYNLGKIKVYSFKKNVYYFSFDFFIYLIFFLLLLFKKCVCVCFITDWVLNTER
jgi:hypothetical protein